MLWNQMSRIPRVPSIQEYTIAAYSSAPLLLIIHRLGSHPASSTPLQGIQVGSGLAAFRKLPTWFRVFLLSFANSLRPVSFSIPGFNDQQKFQPSSTKWLSSIGSFQPSLSEVSVCSPRLTNHGATIQPFHSSQESLTLRIRCTRIGTQTRNRRLWAERFSYWASRPGFQPFTNHQH